jgi:hypothetical protein
MVDSNPGQLPDFSNLNAQSTAAGMGLTNAQTQVAQQQAQVAAQAVQSAQIANANQIMSYNLRRKALLDFSGQSDNSAAAQPPASDAQGLPVGGGPSGAAPPSASAASAPVDPNAPPPDPNAPPPAPVGVLPGSPMPSDDDLGESLLDHRTVDQGLRARFFTNPAGTPQEMNQISQAALSGDKSLLEYATTRRDMGVLTRKAANERDANSLYESMTDGVVNAPAGRAADAFEAISPQVAAAIRKEHPNDPDAQDEAARDTAAHIAAVVHQYSGRGIDERKDGTYVDSVTKQPLPDTPHAGMSTDQVASVMKDANELIDQKNSDGSVTQVPRYKVAGYDNAAQYLHAIGDQYRAQNLIPPVQYTPLGTAQTKLAAMAQHVANVNAQPGSQPGAAAAPAAPVDPVLRQALTDPDYKIQVPRVIPGTSQTPAQAKQAETTVQARTDLLKDSQDATSAAAQSMQYMQAAKAILDSKQDPSTGAYGALIAKASALMPGTHVDATNYAEVAKYLGNAALAQAKGIYGARMTQSEVGLQLNELSPSTKMPDSAIRDLLDTNIRSAAYTINAARKSKLYLASGGDPQKYSDWLEQYYPRAQSVNNTQPARPGQQGSAQRSIVRTGTINGRKVAQYSDGSTGYVE